MIPSLLIHQRPDKRIQNYEFRKTEAISSITRKFRTTNKTFSIFKFNSTPKRGHLLITEKTTLKISRFSPSSYP